jgi:putative oxidoreductase
MIGSSLTKYRDVGLLILRLGIGGAFIAHGWPKISGGTGYWAGLGTAMPLPGHTFWGFMGAITEFGGGILFAIGLLFRPVCALLVIQMIVAISYHLRLAPPPMNTWAIWSHPFEDLVVFLGMFLIGPGRYSVDGEPLTKR